MARIAQRLAALSLCDRAEGWFDVEDRRPVEGLEVAHKDPQAVGDEDLDAVQADRVGTVG
jgi:hypothetical protein